MRLPPDSLDLLSHHGDFIPHAPTQQSCLATLPLILARVLSFYILHGLSALGLMPWPVLLPGILHGHSPHFPKVFTQMRGKTPFKIINSLSRPAESHLSLCIFSHVGVFPRDLTLSNIIYNLLFICCTCCWSVFSTGM